jgi:hypothetical protein
MRSPLVRQNTSPSVTNSTPLDFGQSMMGQIDLNLTPEDTMDDPVGQEDGDGLVGQEDEDGPVGQEDGDHPVGQEDGDADDPIGTARKNLLVSNEKRRAIFEALLGRARSGHLKRSETREVSVQFSVPIRTVQRIWKKGKGCLDQGLGVDVSTEKSRCGCKKKVVDISKLQDIPLPSRTTIEDVAKHLGVSKTKVHRMKREGLIKRVSNTIKLYLTDNNKKDHLKWCLSMLDPRSVTNDPVFKGLFNYVFIDEKWFYITRKALRYYIISGDNNPRERAKTRTTSQRFRF